MADLERVFYLSCEFPSKLVIYFGSNTMTLRFRKYCYAITLPVTESAWFGIVHRINEKTKLNLSASEFPFRCFE